MNRILYRYIFRELINPFILILFVLTGILFLARSIKLVNLIINKTASLGEIVILFSYVIPEFLEMAIPMAFLLSIIITFGRLSRDSELIVMRSVGLSFNKLLIPLGGFALLCTALALVISLWIRPAANFRLGLGLFNLAASQISSGLNPGEFSQFGPFTMYARETRNNGRDLSDAIIADDRDPAQKRVFFAQNARVNVDSNTRSIELLLFDGILQDGSGLSLSHTTYDSAKFNISEEDLSSRNKVFREKKNKEKGTFEILREKKFLDGTVADSDDQKIQSHYNHLRVELQKRLVLPTSCIFIALLAIALGVQPSRKNEKWGSSINLGLGILFILSYYTLYALTSAISQTNGKNIIILMWLPNFVFMLIGIWFFRKIATEKWDGVSDRLIDVFGGIRTFFSRNKEA